MVDDPGDIIFSAVTERQLQFLRLDAAMRKDVLKELRKLEKEIVSRIITDDVSFNQRRLRKMLSDIRSTINDAYLNIDELAQSDLIELAKIESAAMVKTLAKVEIDTTTLPLKKIETLVNNSLIEGAPSSAWWSRQSAQLNQRFSDEMRTGVLLGETNDELVKRVRGTKDFNFTNGVMNTSRRDAESLVRSSVQSSANQARFETMEQVNHLINAYRYVATLDSHTTERCIVRDGLRWDATTKEPLGHSIPFQVPPIHWACRSTLISEIEGVNVLKDATRSSVDGQVAAKTTFKDFLKSKDKAFQDEVLGAGKADLWREGKITLPQLLDQSENPLTLTELRAKYG